MLNFPSTSKNAPPKEIMPNTFLKDFEREQAEAKKPKKMIYRAGTHHT